jgi:hypothetical protein
MLIAVIILALGSLFVIAEVCLRETYNVPAETIAIPTGASSIAKDKHLVDAVAAGSATGPTYPVVHSSSSLWNRRFRAGVLPTGLHIPASYTRRSYYANMSADELQSIRRYLQSIPAKPSRQRRADHDQYI